MFTTRPNDLHIAFRVAGFVRVGLTTFPSISPVTCDSDTAVLLANCLSFTSYQTTPLERCITLLALMQAKRCDSFL